MDIALIDYGASNVHSVEKALRCVGAQVRRVQSGAELGKPAAIVLPGVGAFDDCITALEERKLLEPIKMLLIQGTPYLGICLGYQILFETSEESKKKKKGLCIITGRVVRFPSLPGLKVPQIGWNQVQVIRPECPLLEGVQSGSYVYFVHSYYPVPMDQSLIVCLTEYGVTFASMIWKDNVFATQFHPEKSQNVGLRILHNFLSYVRKL